MNTLTKTLSNFIPQALKDRYVNFVETTFRNLLPSKRLYRVFQVKSKISNLDYTIRIFNIESDLAIMNLDAAITLFFQEIFYLCKKFSDIDIIKIEDFIYSDGKIGVVMKSQETIQEVIEKDYDSMLDKLPPLDVEKMLKDVALDIKFLQDNMNLTVRDSVPGKIDHIIDTNLFLLDNWATADYSNRGELLDQSFISSIDETINSSRIHSINAKYISPELRMHMENDYFTSETLSGNPPIVYSLGIIGLELCGVWQRKVRNLIIKQDNSDTYSKCLTGIKAALKEARCPNSTIDLLIQILQKDPRAHLNINEMRALSLSKYQKTTA